MTPRSTSPRELVADHDRLRVVVRDSKGLSQQLCASVSHDFDPDGADEQEIAETMGRLIEKTERVGIAVKPADCSLLTTLDDVQELVDAVTATAREL